MTELQQLAAGLAALAAGVAGGWYLLRGGWRVSKRVHRLADSMLGDRETGQPGVVDRLVRIETELHPNGGSSMRDAITRCEVTLGAVDGRMAGVESRLAAVEAHTPVQVNVGAPGH